MKFENHTFKAIAILVLAFASYVIPAHSQGTAAPKKSGSKAPVTWKQEPTSFIGISLNQPLTASVKECPRGGPFVELCLLRVEDPAEVCCVQIEPFEKKAYVSTSDMKPEGKVGSIQVNFETLHFKQVADMMIVKYGRPHKQEVNKVKTKGGLSLTVWKCRGSVLM